MLRLNTGIYNIIWEVNVELLKIRTKKIIGIYRNNFTELEKQEQDLAITSHLVLHCRIPELKNELYNF